MPTDKWELRKKTDEQLHEFIAGWKPNTEGHIAGTQELRRRNEAPINLRSWIAIAISFVAIVVSIISLIVK